MDAYAAGLAAGLLAVVLGGCGSAGDPGAVATPGGSGCPPPDAEGTAMIDWVPFVRVDGLMYQPAQPAQVVDEAAVGAAVATVTCRIADTVGNPGFRPRDGDAAFLAEGTPVHELAGYRTSFRLAVLEAGKWRVYEADDVPGARTGADLLDLSAGVRALHLVEGDRGEDVVASVEDPAEVDRVVEAVLAAPVAPERPDAYASVGEEAPLFVRFEMADGTAVQRAWHVRAGLLWRGIRAPDELAAALGPPGA